MLSHATTNPKRTTGVKGKVKSAEWAKPGKKARLINDMGIEASIVGGYATSIIKEAMACSPQLIPSKPFNFIKAPNPTTLDGAFVELMAPTHHTAGFYFSDDSCFSARCLDGVLMANIDISGADCSHTKVIFDILQEITPPGPLAEAIRLSIKQCRDKLILPHPSQQSKAIVTFTEPRLFSGSTLTTVINNVGTSLIFLALSEVDFSKITIAEAGPVITAAARRVGYKITCEIAQKPQQLQFLKHSPDRHGKAHLNIGVILRSIGVCHGDLPGRKSEPLSMRSQRFCSQLTAGWRCAGDNAICDAIKNKYPPAGKPRYTNYLLAEAYQTVHWRDNPYFDEIDMFDRYDVTPCELDELVKLILTTKSNSTCGIVTSATIKILKLDYGLGPPVIQLY
jgi:hypothetical protein